MPLDFVTDLVTFDESSRSRKGRPAGGIPVGRGECGARGRICTPLPGGLGIMPAGTMTGVRGASLDWDRRWRVTPAQTASQEAWLKPRLRRRKSLWREPWWNADRRAVPQGQRRTRWCGGYGSAFVGVPLPFFFGFICYRRNGRSEEKQRGATPRFPFPPRPSRFRLRAPRFGGLKPAVARRASGGGSRGRVLQSSGAKARPRPRELVRPRAIAGRERSAPRRP